MKKITLLLLLIVISINLSGCAPSISKFTPKPTQKVNPVGLYIIIGTFGGSIEADYREELLKRFTDQITSSMTPKGYEFVVLNDKIDQKKVYHSSLFWYINEKKIARQAAENGCETAYIVFYYLENYGGWKVMQNTNHLLVNSWLLDAKSGNVIAEDSGYVASPLFNMASFVQDSEDISSRNTHIRYLDWINKRFDAAATINK
ncbi:MAG: hypothetical protein JW745_10200 [Sedimentisphaerales bacterium]|nr:hypothetical protein [Sedimentisphaerales bacterium]MBN2842729.1 hypothetical protein [Sedimentisphaerales bacterium]